MIPDFKDGVKSPADRLKAGKLNIFLIPGGVPSENDQ
jgi:hypothetical protein